MKLHQPRAFPAARFTAENIFPSARRNQYIVPLSFFASIARTIPRNSALGVLPFSKNYFGESLPARSMMIHLRKAQIFERQML